MTVKYVVSIAGTLLYFDQERRAAQPFPESSDPGEGKPALKLIPPEQSPAAASEWNDALAAYSAEQRRSAEISEVL